MSEDPAIRAKAMVEAVTHWQEPGKLAEICNGLGEAMKGIEIQTSHQTSVSRTEVGKFLKTIGILALQGGYDAHQSYRAPWWLGKGSSATRKIRLTRWSHSAGGASTTMLKLLNRYDFFPALQDWFGKSRPTLGTCTGEDILLAKYVF